MDDYIELSKRSLQLHEIEMISKALYRLNALGTEFDGVLKQYDQHGKFVGLYWMDMESEEWMFDPLGKESDG